MTNGYIEILIIAPVDANELSGLIHQPGLLGTWDDQDRIHVYWDPEQWTSDTRHSILHALTLLDVSDPEPSIRVDTLPWKDWNAEWARLVRPVQIGQRILIRPSWHSPPTPPSPIELILDPKQAFGTGHHTTTQLVIEMMETCIHGGERILDIGTGSGILSMIGVRLGAYQALGIDTDPQAITCAEEYARMNSFGEELQFRNGQLLTIPIQPYDLLVANIDRRTLLTLAPHLRPYANQNSRLLVSGILREDMEEIITIMINHSWSVLTSTHREGWVAIHFQCTGPSQEINQTVQVIAPSTGSEPGR